MVSPAISRAQQTRLRTIGVLMGLEAGDQLGQAEFNSLQHGLRELGWNHGQNVQLEVRWPGTDIDRIGTAAKELVTLHPEIIVARGTPVNCGCPTGNGSNPNCFPASCRSARRGVRSKFRTTGRESHWLHQFRSVARWKWLELLKQIAPRVDRVAVLFNPDTAPYGIFLKSIETAASTFHVRSTEIHIRNVSDLESAISNISREPGAGIVQIPSHRTGVRSRTLSAIASATTWPAAARLGS